jgi:Tfp pilus assembly protein FimT
MRTECEKKATQRREKKRLVTVGATARAIASNRMVVGLNALSRVRTSNMQSAQRCCLSIVCVPFPHVCPAINKE